MKPAPIATSTFIDPLSKTWTGPSMIGDILMLIQRAIKENNYGPYILMLHPRWKTILEESYVSAMPSLGTLYDRILKIEQMLDVRLSDEIAESEGALIQVGT